MIPAGPLLAALAAWLALGAAAAWWAGRLQEAWWLAAVGLAGLAALDALLARLGALPDLQREVSGAVALGARTPVRLRITRRSFLPLRAVVRDHPSATLVAEGLPQPLRLVGRVGAWGLVTYHVRATQRGLQQFAPAALRLRSPLALWWRQVRIGPSQEVRVYPSFQAVAKFALLARENRLAELGIHKRQRRGEGSDFLQLREYRAGDSLRQIDWRATARLRKAISREYHDERDQQIVFLIDHGRHMRSQDGELSHLDHALNAVLLLAYVALRQGDGVGLLTFGGEQRWLAPRKGPSFINVILNTVFDLGASLDIADPQQAAQLLMRRLNKRSLIVLITNVRDDPGDALQPILRLAQRRHVVLLASLRERILNDVLDELPQDHAGALRTAAVHQYLRERELTHRRIDKAGAFCLDTEPHRLPVELVNHYLAIKGSGVL